MMLHLPGLHAPRWLTHAFADRAMALVLGIIGASLVLGALRVLDATVSGTLVEAPAAAAAMDAGLVDVPAASAEAIRL